MRGGGEKGFSAPAQHVKLISDSMLSFFRPSGLGGAELILIKVAALRPHKNATLIDVMPTIEKNS